MSLLLLVVLFWSMLIAALTGAIKSVIRQYKINVRVGRPTGPNWFQIIVASATILSTLLGILLTKAVWQAIW